MTSIPINEKDYGEYRLFKENIVRHFSSVNEDIKKTLTFNGEGKLAYLSVNVYLRPRTDLTITPPPFCSLTGSINTIIKADGVEIYNSNKSENVIAGTYDEIRFGIVLDNLASIEFKNRLDINLTVSLRVLPGSYCICGTLCSSVYISYGVYVKEV